MEALAVAPPPPPLLSTLNLIKKFYHRNSHVTNTRHSFCFQMRYNNLWDFCQRVRYSPRAICSVSSGVRNTEATASQWEGFSVLAASANDAAEFKVTVEVSGTRTQGMFDNVFSKMVADAQPIPGFRRIKGGNTPNIPPDILLEILGPSNVYRRVIEKLIDSTIAEYIEKEGLRVSKELRVGQSFEDLEAAFRPGDKFRFDVFLHLQTTS